MTPQSSNLAQNRGVEGGLRVLPNSLPKCACG